jgi:alginate O-acetyltransferase complex protein AlgI
MLPKSIRFFEFFLVIFVLYWFPLWHKLRIPLPLPGRPRLTGHEVRVWLLLGASLFCLATWDHGLLLTGRLLIVPCIGYVLALGMDRVQHPRVRKRLLIASLAVNLGWLFYFKYAAFFLESLQGLADRLGFSVPQQQRLFVLLPVGISFYTLRSVGYALDVYRRRLPAERNLARFLLYLLFLPDLLAGPVRRARPFLAQVARARRWSWSRLGLGAEYWAMGLVKILVVADRMAEFVDPVFRFPSDYQTQAVWLAVIGYALQLYCDCSGYLDMATGMAHLLGFRSVPNFNMPYLATSIADFWQRFNISLTTWLRDYVYTPLCGRHGERRLEPPTISVHFDYTMAVLVTATLGGLWSGAGNMFLLFGFLHGVLLVCNRSVRRFCRRRRRLDALLQTGGGTALRRLVTFTLVCATLVIFRSHDARTARSAFHALAVWQDGLPVPLPLGIFLAPALAVALCHVAGHFRLWQRIQARLAPPTVFFSRGFVSAFLLAICFLADRFLPLPPHVPMIFISL